MMAMKTNMVETKAVLESYFRIKFCFNRFKEFLVSHYWAYFLFDLTSFRQPNVSLDYARFNVEVSLSCVTILL